MKDNNYHYWIQVGDRYYQQGDYCQALNVYTNVLQSDPSNPLLLSKKGNTLYMLQQYDAADLAYAEALNNSNAVVIVYEYILENFNDLETNLWWLQDKLYSQYNVEIIFEGLTQVVYQMQQELIEEANQTSTNQKQSIIWKPFLNDILKFLGVPFASSLTNVLSSLQQNNAQKTAVLLQKKSINKMSWQQFELLIEWFFEKQGYKVKRMKKSHDQGADMILKRNDERVVVQIKKQKKTTGNKAVQEVHSARGYYQANRAIVITSSRYSKPARELAKRLDVELWDWKRLLTKLNNTSKQPFK
jgi:HJR/Mrr/RecB family endonuclease